MVKQGGRYQNQVMQKFEAMEELKRKKAKEVEIGATGCILEEASTRLGGQQNLRQAVARGLQGMWGGLTTFVGWILQKNPVSL